MGNLRTFNWSAGTESNPVVLTGRQLQALVSVAGDETVESDVRGWITLQGSVPQIGAGNYYLLNRKYNGNAGGNTAHWGDAHEGERQLHIMAETVADTYSVYLEGGNTVDEGSSAYFTAQGIDIGMLEMEIIGRSFSLEDGAMTEAKAMERIALTREEGMRWKLSCGAASENDTWQMTLTVKVWPFYNETTVKTVTVVVRAQAMTGIRISGPDMVNKGETVAYEVTLLPASATKRSTNEMWMSLRGGFVGNTNVYRINGEEARDTVSVTATLSSGEQLTASKDIILGVDLLNDTEKNPKMFAVIKEALELGEDVTSFSVVDAMAVTNEQMTAINDLVTDNVNELYDFEELEYFTGVSYFTSSKCTSRSYVNAGYRKLKFPRSIAYIAIHLTELTSDLIFNEETADNYVKISGQVNCGKFDGRRAEFYGGNNLTLISVNNITLRCEELIHCPAIISLNVMNLYVNGDKAPYIDWPAVDENSTWSGNHTVYITTASVIELPNNIRYLPHISGANIQYFRYNGADNVNLPNTITKIRTFKNCTQLRCTTLPTLLTSIDGSAFQNCYNLNVQTIPAGITGIGSFAFQNCFNCFTNKKINIQAGTSTILNRFQDPGLDVFYKVTGFCIDASIYSQQNYTRVNKLYDIRGIGGVTQVSRIAADQNSPLMFVDLTTFARVLTKTSSNGSGRVPPIYVPNNLVAVYKSATNWAEIAENIYGKTQMMKDALINGVNQAGVAGYYGRVQDENGNEITDAEDVTDTCDWLVHPFDIEYSDAHPLFTAWTVNV